jgi:hypothetical protein
MTYEYIDVFYRAVHTLKCTSTTLHHVLSLSFLFVCLAEIQHLMFCCNGGLRGDDINNVAACRVVNGNAVPSCATVVNPDDFPLDKNSSCICLFKIHNERDCRFSSSFNEGSNFIKI